MECKKGMALIKEKQQKRERRGEEGREGGWVRNEAGRGGGKGGGRGKMVVERRRGAGTISVVGREEGGKEGGRARVTLYMLFIWMAHGMGEKRDIALHCSWSSYSYLYPHIYMYIIIFILPICFHY